MRTIIMSVVIAACAATVEAKPVKAPVVDRAVEMIARHESFRSAVYTCDGGKKTIGYGCTDPAVIAKGSITKAEALTLLKKKVRAELVWVEKTFPGLNDNQKVAVISAAYNIGHTGLCWKTVKGKKVRTNFYNAMVKHDFSRAQKELQDWNKAGGKVLNGLVKRRAEEGKYLVA